MTPKHPDKAMVKAGTFRRLIADIRRASGLTVNNGDVASLPTGGKNIVFKSPPVNRAFLATGGSASIRLGAGIVTYAGRGYYFPTTVYTGASGGMVALKVDVGFNVAAVFDGPDEKPWSAVLDETNQPQFLWVTADTLGQHARIRNPPDSPDIGIENYTLDVDSGTVYFPIAGWTGNRLTQYRSGNIALKAQPTGRLSISTF